MAARTRRERRTKLRATQPMFYDNRLVAEGEVFWFEGDVLPVEDVAMPVDDATPLGVAPPPPVDPNVAPSWTTKGHVDRANRELGRREEADELLL